jgi:hypothetical protein
MISNGQLMIKYIENITPDIKRYHKSEFTYNNQTNL